MKKILLKIVFGVHAVLAVFGLLTMFVPWYSSAEIQQNIGGVLICSSVYTADHHTWQYDVSYKYQTSDDSIVYIGSGTYYGREWNEDEQLVQYKNWLLLKTGGWGGTDKILIGNIKTKQWTEYEFTPDSVVKDSVWIKQGVNSLLNYCCPETFVSKIWNGEILLSYKFRTGDKYSEVYSSKKVYYRINEQTGQPEMTKVE